MKAGECIDMPGYMLSSSLIRGCQSGYRYGDLPALDAMTILIEQHTPPYLEGNTMATHYHISY